MCEANPLPEADTAAVRYEADPAEVKGGRSRSLRPVGLHRGRRGGPAALGGPRYAGPYVERHAIAYSGHFCWIENPDGVRGAAQALVARF